MKLALEVYNSNEAAAISGLAADAQRNWRRRGYLPKIEGNSRLTLPDLAVFAVMAQLSERGIGPNVSQTFAEEAKRAIFLHSLTMGIYSREALTAAYELHRAQIDREADAMMASLGDREEVRKVVAHMVREKLAEVLKAETGVRGAIAPGYLVIWAEGSSEFVAGAEDPFASEDHWFDDPRRQGGVLIFPLAAIAYKLASRLPRPAIKLAEAKA
ncbi:MAG: hypothetical protein CML46_18065 [Rhodobacteraceae bacterium]|nr:hypothetical protein [Paracoccaceae bacterium]MBR28822.1 hypothetical protein [Paracoccaceae bacterium]